jgi:RNA polymerase sigma factor for flagellar operon FliA
MSLHNENLILQNLSLVKSVATKFQKKYGDNFEYDDLVGWGYFGLIDAAKEYNPNLLKFKKFKTFAWEKINWSIIDGLRTNGLKHRNNKEKTEGGYVFNFPTYWHDIYKKNDDDNDNKENFEELYPDQDWENDFLEVEKKEEYQKLHQSVNKLSERDQKIINMYYWENKTLIEIGKEMNFNESRACQKINKIIEKLRKDYLNEIKPKIKTSKNGKSYFKAISPSGEIYCSNNQTKFAKEYNLSQSKISEWLSGKCHSSLGWKFYWVSNSE